MAFTSMFETHEAEASRLAESPEGSTNHRLSRMPVQVRGEIQDRLIELPRLGDETEHTIVVVPVEQHPLSDDLRTTPRQRYRSSWTCIVVASDHPSYPVGCWRLSLPEYQLRRGVQRSLAL